MPLAAANPVQDAVKDLPALFVLVKSQPHEVVHCAAWLRRAERVRKLQVSVQRVGISLSIFRASEE